MGYDKANDPPPPGPSEERLVTRGGRDRLLADAQIALGPACLVYFPITRRDNPVTRRGQLEPPRVRGHRLEGGIAQLDELRARRRRDNARRCADGRGDEGVGDHGLPTAPLGAGTPPPPPDGVDAMVEKRAQDFLWRRDHRLEGDLEGSRDVFAAVAMAIKLGRDAVAVVDSRKLPK